MKCLDVSQVMFALAISSEPFEIVVLEAGQYSLYFAPYEALAHALVTGPASEDHNGPHRLRCPTGFNQGWILRPKPQRLKRRLNCGEICEFQGPRWQIISLGGETHR